MSKSLKRFQRIVWDYYKLHRRDLPWRNTTNPYNIFVSEIMLQQTQVSRVLTKYEPFINFFPDFPTLASASFEQVLKLWSGLGYNRRALHLHKSAKIIVQELESNISSDPLLLEKLPGIGKATAASIVVFSYNTPLVFIETNIRRVFIHHFFKDGTKVHDRDIYPLIERTLDQEDPREWYYGLMDYGSYLSKIVQNPNRKSTHYVRQSKFEGSVRQQRGKILRELLRKKTLLLEGDALFEKAAQELIQEGFIVCDNNMLRLSSQD